MEYAEQIYSNDRGTVHYYLTFDDINTTRPWMVFLPGLTAEHHLFDFQIEYFKETYNCFSWDAPAHGESRPYALDFTLDEVAMVLKVILDREGIRNPIMIGQSYGGYITQVFNYLYPEFIRAFICIDSCSLQKKLNSSWVISSLKHTEGMYLMIPWKILVPWSMQISTSEAGKQNYREAITKYQKKEFCKLTGRGFASVADAIETGRDFSFKCPVLLFCGKRDSAGVTKKLNRIWTKNTGYPLVWVPNGGHNSNIDNPDYVNSHITDFLQGIDNSD